MRKMETTQRSYNSTIESLGLQIIQYDFSTKLLSEELARKRNLFKYSAWVHSFLSCRNSFQGTPLSVQI